MKAGRPRRRLFTAALACAASLGALLRHPWRVTARSASSPRDRPAATERSRRSSSVRPPTGRACSHARRSPSPRATPTRSSTSTSMPGASPLRFRSDRPGATAPVWGHLRRCIGRRHPRVFRDGGAARVLGHRRLRAARSARERLHRRVRAHRRFHDLGLARPRGRRHRCRGSDAGRLAERRPRPAADAHAAAGQRHGQCHGPVRALGRHDHADLDRIGRRQRCVRRLLRRHVGGRDPGPVRDLRAARRFRQRQRSRRLRTRGRRHHPALDRADRRERRLRGSLPGGLSGRLARFLRDRGGAGCLRQRHLAGRLRTRGRRHHAGLDGPRGRERRRRGALQGRVAGRYEGVLRDFRGADGL